MSDNPKEMWNALDSDEDHKPAVDKKRKRKDVKVPVNKGFFRQKKQETETNPEQVASVVVSVIARLEIAAEDDYVQNRNGLPAVNKLKALPLLTNALLKKQYHQGFLNHGIFNLLRMWLEPLPDGSLPNLTIRSAILDILTNHLPVNLRNPVWREQLKKSGLGKVVMFLWKSGEEKLENRRLARELVFRWSRDIFDKSTNYGDLTKSYPCKSSLANREKVVAGASRLFDQDVDFGLKCRSTGSTFQEFGVKIPERSPMDFVFRPKSNCAHSHRVKQLNQEETVRKHSIRKKITMLKKNRKPQRLPGIKLNIQDRGIFTNQDT